MRMGSDASLSELLDKLEGIYGILEVGDSLMAQFHNTLLFLFISGTNILSESLTLTLTLKIHTVTHCDFQKIAFYIVMEL